MKGKMMISVDVEKAFDKIPYRFLIKTLYKVGVDGNHLHMIKTMHGQPTANIILSGARLSFSSKIRNKTGRLTSLLASSLALEVPARAAGGEEEIKGIETGKEEVK